MSFDGRWCLKDMSNAIPFYEAVGSPEEWKTMLRACAEAIKTNPSVYVEEYKVDRAAGTLDRTVYLNGEKRKTSGIVKLNTEFDGLTSDGRSAKVKIVFDSDTKLIKTEKGDGFAVTSTLDVSGDLLTVTQTGNGATAVYQYVRG